MALITLSTATLSDATIRGIEALIAAPILLVVGTGGLKMWFDGLKIGNMTIDLLIPARKDRKPLGYYASATILVWMSATALSGAVTALAEAIRLLHH